MHGLVKTGGFPLVLAIDEAQKAHGVCGPVGEIGVFDGKLTILLGLLAREDERVVAVDPYARQPARVKEGFWRNVRTHLGEPERVVLLEEDSKRLSAAGMLAAADGRLRLLSIDGGHDAETVEHDLLLARDVLAEGGVIVLDDYFHESFPGVSEGTNRVFLRGRQGDLVPFAIGGNKMMFCGRDFAPDYARALRTQAFSASLQQERLFGAPVLCYNFAPFNFFGSNVSQRWVNTRA